MIASKTPEFRNTTEAEAEFRNMSMAEFRDKSIGVRFTTIEKAAVEKWAEAQDLPASVVIRRMVLETLRKEGFLK